MQTTLTNLKSPALIGLLATLPFIALELINRRNFDEGFPIPLFVILWLLPTIFLLLVRNIQIQNKLMLVIRIAFLLAIFVLWIAIIKDQMPCFLGVPNCD